MADTTYNSLGVDEVAAQHAKADCVVSAVTLLLFGPVCTCWCCANDSPNIAMRRSTMGGRPSARSQGCQLTLCSRERRSTSRLPQRASWHGRPGQGTRSSATGRPCLCCQTCCSPGRCPGCGSAWHLHPPRYWFVILRLHLCCGEPEWYCHKSRFRQMVGYTSFFA